jgi:glycosyltransferase involved in cell wall biosynthesis
MEGISSTLLEAMGCETCVIASNVGGNVEIIKNNKTGVLVEPNNAEELVEKISHLLTENKKRAAMAANGLKTVVKYDWKQVGKLYLDIYESLLK